MTKTRKVFYNESRRPYMTKRSYKPFLREAHGTEDYEDEFDNVNDPRYGSDFEETEQNEDDAILDQIYNLVTKINAIRKGNGSYDLLDADSFPVSWSSVADLQDMLDEEQGNAMMDREPSREELERNMDDIFDDPTTLDEQPVPVDNGDENLDDNEAKFVKALDKQLKYDDVDRTPFYMALQSDPGVDYEAIVITKFGSGLKTSFLFNIISIDGEETDIERQIRLQDIDIENTDFSDLLD